MVLLNDLRFALRRLLRAPGFAAVATLTLALGIGATTAIYSVIDALMLRPLPYRDAARLADLGVQAERGVHRYFDADQVTALKSRTDLFDSVDAFDFAGMVQLGANEPTQAAAAVVGGDLLSTLGVGPQLGRLIDSSDVRSGRAVIVLSDSIWRSRFGADPAVISRTIQLDDRTVEVIGVMPPSFKFPNVRQEVWLPFNPSTARANRPMFVVARLRSDIPLAQARARVEAGTIDARNSQGAVVPTPLRVTTSLGRFLNPPVRTAILVLAGAVGLVLLIACANIANLLMVQNAGRQREMAVRTALGASRMALVRQLLTESVVLAVIGGTVGLLVAQWFIDILASSAPQDSGIINVNGFGLDRRVLLFALAATTFTACLSGIVPAIKGARRDSQDALRSGGHGTTSGRKQERARNVFVVLQLAISVVLLVGATLLARTFVHLTRVEPGFEMDRLALTSLELPSWRYRTEDTRREFFASLVERVRALPGVTDAALTSGGVAFNLTFEVEGRGVVLRDPSIEVPFTSVTSNYFSTMRIPIILGRGFTEQDVRGAPSAIVISQALASRLWPQGNPIGQRFRTGTRERDPWYTVVGVAGNVYAFDYAETRNQLAYYRPTTQTGMSATMTMVARTTGDPASVLPLVRDQIRAIDPSQPIWKMGTGATEFAEFLALPRFYTLLTGALAALGVVIAAIGLYGVLAYAISLRTREFGVRLALGAQKSDLLGMVLRTGGWVTALGLVVGILGSLFLTRWIQSMLIDVPRLDPLSYVAASILFGLIALAACWIPARRATRVDPVVALRAE
jgi:putative ABC transport system permease protein